MCGFCITSTWRACVLYAVGLLRKRRKAWQTTYHAFLSLCLLWSQGGACYGARVNRQVHRFCVPVVLLKTLDQARPVVEAQPVHSKQVKPGSKKEELLRAWTQALGGLDSLRRIENVYVRGSIETGGLRGTFEEWRIAQGQHKQS